MDLIRTDEYGNEIEYVQNADIDFEISDGEDSKLNTFCVEFQRSDWKTDIVEGCRFFSPGTEYGGIYKKMGTDTSVDLISVEGYTWRGMMCRKVIRPKNGEDYAYASGELNSIIKEKVESEFPGLFYGVETDTGVTVNNYQFERYCTLHDGLKKMLASVNYRLKITYVQGEYGMSGYVRVQAVPIVDYSSDIELSQDEGMNFTMKETKNGVNHLICLGKGELKDRIVIDLYVDENGKIGESQYYFGADELAEVYDSNGSEESDLRENGTKKLETIKDSKEYNMTIENLENREIDIGDIVGGRDYITEVEMKKPIERKIWTISSGKEKVEFKLKGDS